MFFLGRSNTSLTPREDFCCCCLNLPSIMLNTGTTSSKKKKKTNLLRQVLFLILWYRWGNWRFEQPVQTTCPLSSRAAWHVSGHLSGHGAKGSLSLVLGTTALVYLPAQQKCELTAPSPRLSQTGGCGPGRLNFNTFSRILMSVQDLWINIHYLSLFRNLLIFSS